MAGRRGTRAPGLLRGARQQRRGERLPHPGDTALAQGAAAPQPANPDQLGQDEPHRDPVDTPDPHRASIPASALRRHAPKVGAQCGSPARWDLCGGPPARAVPTATSNPTPATRRNPRSETFSAVLWQGFGERCTAPSTDAVPNSRSGHLYRSRLDSAYPAVQANAAGGRRGGGA